MADPIEPLLARPVADQFQPVAEYQSSTPSTFFGGVPVLHYANQDCTLSISQADLDISELLVSVFPPESAPRVNGSNGTDHSDQTQRPLEAKVETWVTSSTLLLWSAATNKGVRVSYPAISLHARQGDGLYMQLVLTDTRHTADEDMETVELVLTPSKPAAGSNGTEPGVNGTSEEKPPIEALYTAVSACADLHPDPDPDDNAAAGEQMASLLAAAGGDLEGAGWITAENVHEFAGFEGAARDTAGDDDVVVDERDEGLMDGNEAQAPLGPGAGNRRAAGEDSDGEETKWRRTS